MYSELVRKECRKCHKLKPLSQYHLNGYRRRDGTSATRNDCKKCNKESHHKYVTERRIKINKYNRIRYRKYDRQRMREYGLKKTYGITLEAYEELLKKQNFKCAICEINQEHFTRRFDVDHCHDSKKIRGLLCIRCNRGIGLLKDDVSVLKKAIEYINKNKS